MSLQPSEVTRAAPGAELFCEASAFHGFEDEMLRLRNTNRDNPETLAYLNWRYERSPEAPEPVLFWLLSPARERIGMAAAIFHPYWLDGRHVQVAVIGDISLDSAWRSRGLGQRLLRFMTAHLDEHFPRHPALVIPTESARRAFARIGWTTAAALAPLVYPLDPGHYLQPLLRSARLAGALGGGLRACARLLVRRHVRRGDELTLSPTPETSFAELARQGSVQVAIRDGAPAGLDWRYVRHPRTRFTFATLRRTGEPRGFLVFEESALPGTCAVYDLAATSAADLQALFALFIERCWATPGLASLRVQLDPRHPARAHLRRLGFIARAAETVVQIHSRDGSAERLEWRVSQGDKDT